MTNPVTFSFEYGFTLVPATTTPLPKYNGTALPGNSSAVETMTTYFVAPWQDLHAGVVPTGKVFAVVCSDGHAGCSTETETWEGTSTRMYETAVRPVDVEGMVTGVSFVLYFCPRLLVPKLE